MKQMNNCYWVETKIITKQAFPTREDALQYALRQTDAKNYHFITTVCYSDCYIDFIVASPTNKIEHVKIVWHDKEN